ncbi:hypothetical protein [Flavisolibacter ginsenosidimutans]|uniref:Uncharacterized protein n=2 Tax=Flavisolibacter ginsenosidimutans TaxID=661481 RepID=A0A5B8UHN1_9BACT|nr:hypothetical protein FSB75_08495 [Flavisolibacter ginsenosidimutans]
MEKLTKETEIIQYMSKMNDEQKEWQLGRSQSRNFEQTQEARIRLISGRRPKMMLMLLTSMMKK